MYYLGIILINIRIECIKEIDFTRKIKYSQYIESIKPLFSIWK